jgi:hypothetical protein
MHDTSDFYRLGHTALLNGLGGKLGSVTGYKECTNAPCFLEHRHILEVHCLLGCTGNMDFYNMHLYDKSLNIWPGVML